MENYKKLLAGRQRWGAIAILAVCFCVGVLGHFSGDAGVPDFIHGFQAGLFTGLEALLVWYVIRLQRAQRNDELLRKLYIKEHDERLASIRLHTFATSDAVSLAGLAVAAIVAGFYDEKVCLTLVLVLVAQVYIKLPFKLYYAKKF